MNNECGLTGRSTGPPTACHPGRAAVWFIICLAARAPRRRRPVNSTLDRRARRHSNRPATSNQGAQMQLPSWHRHIINRGFWRRSQGKGQPLRSAAGPRSIESSGAVCSATRDPVSQGRFAPPCFAGQSVAGLRRQEAAHSKHRWSLCRRLVCQRLKSERPPLQFAK